MTPYTELTIDQLRSCLVERDEQLMVALVQVEKFQSKCDSMKQAGDSMLKNYQDAVQSLSTKEKELEVWKTKCQKHDEERRQVASHNHDLQNQLKSSRGELEVATAACAAMRHHLDRICSQDFLTTCDVNDNPVTIASKALSPTIGTDFLARYKALEDGVCKAVKEIAHIASIANTDNDLSCQRRCELVSFNCNGLNHTLKPLLQPKDEDAK